MSDWIAHRNHKYIKREMVNGKWRYWYKLPSKTKKASSNYNDINWSENRNGYTYTHGDKVLRENYPWRYNSYELPAGSHNSENTRKRKIASQVSTEGRRKEQLAEKKSLKENEKYFSAPVLGRIRKFLYKKYNQIYK